MNPPNDERSGRGVSWWVILLVVLPILYAASVGPAIWMLTTVDPDYDGPLTTIFTVVYLPLQYAFEFADEPQWFQSYVEFWES